MHFDDFGINAGFVEEQYYRYLENPQLVHPSWRTFFEQLGNAADTVDVEPIAGTNGNGNGQRVEVAAPRVTHPPVTAFAQAQVANLVNAYRRRAHLYADVNPLTEPQSDKPELALSKFGLSELDLDKTFSTGDMPGPRARPLRQIIATLEETYCRSIGVEFLSCDEPELRWLIEKMEGSENHIRLSKEEEVRVLTRLTDAEALEQFMHKNFVGAKRFSLEGAESLIPLLDLLIEKAGEQGVEEIVMGMAHRGRLNVLCNIMGKNVRELFAAFEDKHPELHFGSGDVKYHLGYSKDVVTQSGQPVHLTLAFNPSHLEFVNPVVAGRARAKQDQRGDAERRRVMALTIHGDAAFMGQGVIAETLNMAGLEGYRTGGTIHVIVNNQVGFTTIPEDSRSTAYATDIARMLKVPVFHVNGEDPEAVVQVTSLAIEYRQKFGKDVLIDMYCYRKWGHNETDEPRFTQPVMYKQIDRQPSVRDVYVRRLLERGQIDAAKAESIAAASKEQLSAALVDARKGDYAKLPDMLGGAWQAYKGGPDSSVPEAKTSVPQDQLLDLLERISTVPEGFHLHPKTRAMWDARLVKAKKDEPLDWGAGEALAFATLLSEGNPIRLSGQDARRGTFSHRHAVVHDIENGKLHTPLAGVATGHARFEVWDSPLSEQGVLGFDYGYSLDSPHSLVIWEAQFGDFANGAQVIIDQFLVAAEDKWRRLSGLVLLLPHGYEGQGPEHSSARLERFLTLCGEDNIQVCNLTTAAQIFHALRRQVLRPWRKPLVIMSPKSLLRAPEASSTLAEIAHGTFQRVIPDQGNLDPKNVSRVLLCSGKVYYDLVARRAETKRDDVAIVRLEQIYPINEELVRALAPYRDGTDLVWVQEEPWNMGSWHHLALSLPRVIGKRLPLREVTRAESASPATGSAGAHKLEQKMLLDEAFR